MSINSVCFLQIFSSGHLKFNALYISAKRKFAVIVKHKKVHDHKHCKSKLIFLEMVLRSLPRTNLFCMSFNNRQHSF